MQSTSAAIAAAAFSGADLGVRANSTKGSDSAAKNNSSPTSGALSNNGFDTIVAETWLQSRWKSIQSRGCPSQIFTIEKPETYKAPAGTGGSAWGPNKKTITERFTNDLLKASTANAGR
ncbi:uncharacterized protein MEPE_03108 [Melanopsichium pennsylvanicum]|uniref:Uncharacterized protein n=1 Tax=Melanopsichium pennsylvanicum TaxID=63383 RepID=A0AAJ4XKE9_9BASI|nr:uncharacterized protein MEPE_03108 [Melanopsichium pennsylvanicum]